MSSHILQLKCRYESKMKFFATDGSNSVAMDANPPLGDKSALTPKQLVLAGMMGCTAMDVVALLKKFKEPLDAFDVEIEVEKSSNGHPEVFTKAYLVYKFQGSMNADRVLDAVNLSMTKYCGVNAMFTKVFPIFYRAELNGEAIGDTQQAFRS